jgi:hypothetical protein
MPGAASQSALQFVGAWSPLNPYGRDALFARLAWCLGEGSASGEGGRSPCDVTRLIQVDDSALVAAGNGGSGGAPRVAFWAWAGWLDGTAAAATHATAPTSPAVLTYNCSGASSQAGIFD